MLQVVFVHLMGNVNVPASGQGAVNGGSLGPGNGIKRIAITMANHHMDRQQLVVSRTVTCQRRPSSAIFQCMRWKKAPLFAIVLPFVSRYQITYPSIKTVVRLGCSRHMMIRN